MKYTPEGKRKTHFVYGRNGQVLVEKNITKEEFTSFVYAVGKKYAKVEGTIDDYLNESVEVGLVYYHHNNLGSTRVMTNQDGEKVFDQDYLPFGGDLPKPGQLEVHNKTGESYKYTGQKEVASIGLYYYGARYYDPAVGRFTRQDSYRGELDNPQTQHSYVYVTNNPLKYIDPNGYWRITVQEYENTKYVDVEYEGKVLGTLGAGVNALPFGSTFDYYGKIQNTAGEMTSWTDAKGGLVDYYVYQPDEELYKRFKELDTSIATISDSMDAAGGYTKIATQFSNSIAKNIVKNAGLFVTLGLGVYDANESWNRAEKDEYIRAMIMEAGLNQYLEEIDNPEDLYVTMSYIEGKLDSYGEELYKKYNEYFGGYFGLNDYTDNHGISIWDRLLGNIDEVKEDKEDMRNKFENLADRLSEDFKEDISDEEDDSDKVEE